MNALELTITRLVLGLVAAVAGRLSLRKEVLIASSRDRTPGPHLQAVARALHAAAPQLFQRHALTPYGYGLRAKFRYLLHLLRATWLLQRSEITLIDNAWLPAHITKRRPGSQVIQVWHAEGAFKRFGHAALGKSGEADGALRRYIHHGYSTALVSSDYVRSAYAEAFALPLEHVHAVGPLNGTWLTNEAEVELRRVALIAQYPALKGQRVLLYAPTFRGRGADRTAELPINLAAIAASLPPGWIVLVKAHPLVSITPQLNHPLCMTVEHRVSVEELFPVADALLTDYSSSIFLWSLLGRPLLLALGDISEYERDPGLFMDPRAAGSVGTAVHTAAEVAAALQGGGQIPLSAYQAFAERYLGVRSEIARSAHRAAALIVAQRNNERQ